MFLIKFFIYTAYSVTNKTMVLWLSKDLGFSDQTAAALVVWKFALVITVFTLLVGSLTDPVGIRRPLFLRATVCLFAGAIMLFLTTKWLVLADDRAARGS
jgi:MFS family permease